MLAQVQAEHDYGTFEAFERGGVRLHALAGAVGDDDLIDPHLEGVVVGLVHGELFVVHVPRGQAEMIASGRHGSAASPTLASCCGSRPAGPRERPRCNRAPSGLP